MTHEQQTTPRPPWRGWGPPPRTDRDRALTYDAERMRLAIREAGRLEHYALSDESFGDTRAYELVVLDDDLSGSFMVILDGRGSTCSCIEGERWGGRQLCRHAAALVALQRAGRLA